MKVKTDEKSVFLRENGASVYLYAETEDGSDPIIIAVLTEGKPIQVGSERMRECNTGIPTDKFGRPQVIAYDGVATWQEDHSQLI